jgi:hypothetical protein
VIVSVCVAAAVLFGPLGVVIYMFLRPPEYLSDVRERELEIRAMERRLGADQVCPYCRNPADPSFLSCPHCGTKLKNACRRCKPRSTGVAALPLAQTAGATSRTGRSAGARPPTPLLAFSPPPVPGSL